jgi:hypothetical protein
VGPAEQLASWGIRVNAVAPDLDPLQVIGVEHELRSMAS